MLFINILEFKVCALELVMLNSVCVCVLPCNGMASHTECIPASRPVFRIGFGLTANHTSIKRLLKMNECRQFINTVLLKDYKHAHSHFTA